MRAVIQRVSRCSVTVENRVIGKTGPGLLVLLGVAHDDTEKDAVYLAEKIVDLLGDSQRAISWGERGNRRVKENFTTGKMVEAHLKLYAGEIESIGQEKGRANS